MSEDAKASEKSESQEQPKPAIVRQRKRGAKIEESQFRDTVATMLLIGQPYAYIQRFLEKSKFSVKFDTLKKFESNYVAKLSEEVKLLMTEQALAERRKREEKVIQNATYANMSRADALIQLLGEAEAQISAMKAESVSTWMSRQEIGSWMDRVYRLRTELEEARLSSEVQIERGKAIEAVVALALKLFKESQHIEEFIKQSDVIRTGPK